MAGERFRDRDWGILRNLDGTVPYDGCHLAVLMDIRDELKRLNSVLGCCNMLRIPRVLDSIAKNTRRPKRKKLRLAKSA